ncbi:hypothetical protein [Parvibacter caecicola]|uniref:Uncharacterized protein n=1 Tax=Parvibacter caecicola TaxID=747645 RepID=A0A4T9T5Y3_9ACTN|nr:hypothetical protein [Parvibacter caecicola]TJW09671.1 hypothetical protein E5982_09080 [Parvibacter caecicola]
MGYSIDSKVKELKKSPEACAVISKFTPGFETDPQMKLVGGLTFRKLAAFPQAGLTPEQVEEIDAALRAIEE